MSQPPDPPSVTLGDYGLQVWLWVTGVVMGYRCGYGLQVWLWVTGVVMSYRCDYVSQVWLLLGSLHSRTMFPSGN